MNKRLMENSLRSARNFIALRIRCFRVTEVKRPITLHADDMQPLGEKIALTQIN